MEALPLRVRVGVGLGIALGMGLTGLAAWWLTGEVAPLAFFCYLGLALGLGIGRYIGLERPKRIGGRRIIILALGAGMLAAALARAVTQASIVQVEGLFFEVLGGVFGAALLHFLLAKLVGPLVFGRVYCGWACWTAALLDLLPYRNSPGRRGGLWPWLRHLHLAASLGLIALLVFGFAYRPDPAAAVGWFLGGVALYYILGVGMALLLKDNRAFCKYLCPAGLLALPAARYSLLKVRGDPQRCNALGECIAACPMDINITDYTRHGVRVLSSECILCQACVNVCPDGGLSLSLGIDPPGHLELLRAYQGSEPLTVIPKRLRKARRRH